MELDEILNDEMPAPVKEAPAEEPAADAPAAQEPKIERVQSREKAWEDKEQAARGRVRDPATGQFVAKEEAAAAEPKKDAEPAKAAAPAKEEPAKPAAAVPQQEFTEKEKAFLRAAQEERGKRQELERRLAAMEAGKTQPDKPVEAAKTFWDDPDGALKAHEQRLEQQSTNARLQTAEFLARQKHPDFDAKVAAFREVLSTAQGPHQAALVQQWIAAQDPAEFAYSFGKNHLELQQVGSIDGLRAQIEKETRLKVEAEMKEKSDKLERERAALPPSLSDARNAGGNRPVYAGPTSLDDILKG